MRAGDHAANKPLGPLEEARPVEQRVPNPDGDAVVGVVWAPVVDVVMLLGEDQASSLKPGHGGRWLFHVHPLVELVRQ